MSTKLERLFRSFSQGCKLQDSAFADECIRKFEADVRECDRRPPIDPAEESPKIKLLMKWKRDCEFEVSLFHAKSHGSIYTFLRMQKLRIDVERRLEELENTAAGDSVTGLTSDSSSAEKAAAIAMPQRPRPSLEGAGASLFEPVPVQKEEESQEEDEACDSEGTDDFVLRIGDHFNPRTD